ncbi:hypothetical protein [Paraherbaspirillum soli]|uniref:Uncharacterized protein n=1 Tax=Paraherbaspirillum soli TaxID=631222 RepID=A0ABW0M9T5_9BURK
MTFAITPDNKLIFPPSDHLHEAAECARLGMFCLEEVLRLLRPLREINKDNAMTHDLVQAIIDLADDRHNLFDVMRARFEEEEKARKK